MINSLWSQDIFIQLAVLFSCHYFADFPMQGDWLSEGKKKSWYFMFVHCMIYASTFVLFAHISLTAALILFVTHFITDPIKARWNLISFEMDQAIHWCVIIFIWLQFYVH